MTTSGGKPCVFERSDGVGKSTLAGWFASHLRKVGVRCILLSFPGNEAGTLGKHMSELHHDPTRFEIQALAPASLQLLVPAHIEPLLARGGTVVLDRMVSLERAGWHSIEPNELFLVTCAEPLRSEAADLWPRWRDDYLRLDSVEERNYPVIVVPNEWISEAKTRILENL